MSETSTLDLVHKTKLTARVSGHSGYGLYGATAPSKLLLALHAVRKTATLWVT